MRATTQLSVAAFTAALVVGAAAQTREPGPAPPNRGIITAEAPRTTPTNNKNAEDLEFLAEAMRSALGELELGELATQRSYDPRVRDYGEKLKRDHTAQATEIERMLAPLNVEVPEEPGAEALAHRARLERLSGQEFDAAFIEMMIAAHTEAIEKYGAQTHANPDRALADFASKSLSMLREHLATAQSLRQ
jgi:putative membrane protein